MKNMRLTFTLLVLSSLLLSSCSEDKIPITTDSEEARQEFLTGRDLFEKLQFNDALINFNKAIVLDSGFVMAYLYLGILQQNPEKKLEYIKKAKSAMDNVSEGERLATLASEAQMNGETKQQEKYLQEMIEIYPRDERALTDLGNYYLMMYNFEKALVYYQRAIEVNPEYPTVYNQLGYTYRHMENYPAAEEAFKKYIALIPGNPNPYDSYAELLLKMGEFDVSIETYQKALELDPDFTFSHFGVASNLIYMREYNKARQQLKRMAKISGSDEEIIRAHYGCAITFLAEGDLEQGLQEIAIMHELSEKNANNLGVIRNFYLKALVLYDFDKLEEAQKELEKGRELMVAADFPAEIEKNLEQTCLFYETLIAVKKGDLKQADSCAEKFATLIKDSDNILRIKVNHSLKGIIASGAGDFSTAVTEFEQSDLHDPLNLYWLARAQVEIGENGKAIENFKKVIQYNGLATVMYVLIRNRTEKILSRLRSS